MHQCEYDYVKSKSIFLSIKLWQLTFLYAGRCVRSKTSSNSSSLLMSGSRGIGGITCDRTHTVDLFDLEEDEIDSDEESDNED